MAASSLFCWMSHRGDSGAQSESISLETIDQRNLKHLAHAEDEVWGDENGEGDRIPQIGKEEGSSHHGREDER